MSARLLSATVLCICLAVSGCGGRLPQIRRTPIPQEQLARANALAREGDILIARGESYAAVLKYLDAAKLDPYSEVIHNKLAIAYTKLNFYDRALDAIKRSIALNREYAFGYNTMGTIYLVQKRPGSAIKNFLRAINYRPEVAFFYLNLANAYVEKKQTDEAMKALRRALALDPEVMSRQGGIGVQSASLQFDDGEHNYILALAYAERGDEKMAMEFLKKAFSGGFKDFKRLKSDKGFEKLRQTQEFARLLEEFGVTL